MKPSAEGESSEGSPVWQQYQALKQQHPDTILFFRLGDFYETFGDDARLVARELQIRLTSRPVARGERVAMAGVPQHSVDNYLARLLARGHRVALAEQLDHESDAPVRKKPAVSRPTSEPQRAEPPPLSPAAAFATQLSLPL
jgi:DNA mismatch repair protein MutS